MGSLSARALNPGQFGPPEPLVTKRVPIGQITRASDTPPEAYGVLDENKVEAMRTRLRRLPPVVLGERQDDGTWPLWDGGHRLEAYRREGRTYIPARVPKS